MTLTNNEFSIAIFSDQMNSVYEHIRSDAQHIGDIAASLSLVVPHKVGVRAFSRCWVVFEKGVIVKAFAYRHFFNHSDPGVEREIELMTQSLPRPSLGTGKSSLGGCIYQ